MCLSKATDYINIYISMVKYKDRNLLNCVVMVEIQACF